MKMLVDKFLTENHHETFKNVNHSLLGLNSPISAAATKRNNMIRRGRHASQYAPPNSLQQHSYYYNIQKNPKKTNASSLTRRENEGVPSSPMMGNANHLMPDWSSVK